MNRSAPRFVAAWAASLFACVGARDGANVDAGAQDAPVSADAGERRSPVDAGQEATAADAQQKPPPANVSREPPPTDPKCRQSLFDADPPATALYVTPRSAVRPFYQWENNYGYCGEVSILQAGLNAGQWMSQLDVRALCRAAGNGLDAPVGALLLQSGPDGYCAAHGGTVDYNAGLLLENEAAANAATCLTHARLAHRTYDYDAQSAGLAGYREYMAWVKAETIAGHPATIGVFIQGGSDEQYDHIVSVMAIGTNHAPTDARYYDDDTVYFDDHGAMLTTGVYPAVPPGAGETKGCAPFVFGYRFGDLPKTRAEANAGPSIYSILVPGLPDTQTHTGGNGVGFGPAVTGHDFAFSVSGPADDDGTALPIEVRVAMSSTGGAPNPSGTLEGLDYENPYIGKSDFLAGCTNTAPPAMDILLEVTLGGLSAGTGYVLYEYDFDAASATNASALAVPTSRFNARAAEATSRTAFVAHGSTFVTRVSKTSQQMVVFRAVPASAP
jgi:hypothetical protein